MEEANNNFLYKKAAYSLGKAAFLQMLNVKVPPLTHSIQKYTTYNSM